MPNLERILNGERSQDNNERVKILLSIVAPAVIGLLFYDKLTAGGVAIIASGEIFHQLVLAGTRLRKEDPEGFRREQQKMEELQRTRL